MQRLRRSQPYRLAYREPDTYTDHDPHQKIGKTESHEKTHKCKRLAVRIELVHINHIKGKDDQQGQCKGKQTTHGNTKSTRLITYSIDRQ